jgi:lysophospholipase L1-like esterase
MKNNIIILSINLLTAFFLAGLIEGLFGYWLNHPEKIPSFLLEPFRKYYEYNDREIIQVIDACAKYDSGLFYILKPGQCEFSNREFSVTNLINSLGVRDDEASLNYPKLVCLGDSFTMGWGVGQKEPFPELLENSLGEKVLNAGVSSYGTARELNLLTRIKTDSLKYLIIQYNSNDNEENIKYIENNFVLNISPKEEYEDLQHYINTRIKYFPGKHTAYIFKYLLEEIFEKDVPSDHENVAEYFIQCLKSSKVALDEVQILVLITQKKSKLSKEFVSKLKNKTKKYPNIEVIDVADELGGNDLFILDGHLTTEGHQKVAKKILESESFNNL